MRRSFAIWATGLEACGASSTARCQIRRVWCRHEGILPGGRGHHLRSGARTTGQGQNRHPRTDSPEVFICPRVLSAAASAHSPRTDKRLDRSHEGGPWQARRGLSASACDGWWQAGCCRTGPGSPPRSGRIFPLLALQTVDRRVAGVQLSATWQQLPRVTTNGRVCSRRTKRASGLTS